MREKSLVKSHNKENIRVLKDNFEKRFPFSILSTIFHSEPDEMTVDELISKVGTWLAILDSERHINLNNKIIIRGARRRN
ncbi:MAG: hypothetical protein QW478_14945 [Candidatus Micrarchaeaceae archaeon]